MLGKWVMIPVMLWVVKEYYFSGVKEVKKKCFLEKDLNLHQSVLHIFCRHGALSRLSSWSHGQRLDHVLMLAIGQVQKTWNITFFFMAALNNENEGRQGQIALWGLFLGSHMTCETFYRFWPGQRKTVEVNSTQAEADKHEEPFQQLRSFLGHLQQHRGDFSVHSLLSVITPTVQWQII